MNYLIYWIELYIIGVCYNFKYVNYIIGIDFYFIEFVILWMRRLVIKIVELLFFKIIFYLVIICIYNVFRLEKDFFDFGNDMFIIGRILE